MTQGVLRVVVDSTTTLAVDDDLYIQNNGTLDVTPAFDGQPSFVSVQELIA